MTKMDFVKSAIDLAKGEDWLLESRREFDRNDAKWVVKTIHLSPDDYPEVYVSYINGRTIYKAWVYPTENYRVDVL